MEKCRLCLHQSDKQIEIFNNEDNPELATIIYECVSIKISNKDELVKTICATCMDQITQWKLFKLSCQKSNTILKEYHESNYNKNRLKGSKNVVKINTNTCMKDDNCSVSEDDSDDEKVGPDLEELLEFDEEFKLEINNIYTCDICLDTFNDCLEYLDHQECHNGNRVFKCNKCEDVFETRLDLVQHESNHKSPCEQCGILILKSSMKLHLIRHTDKHKCEECCGRFNSRAGLAQHIITVHTDIKDHICETCGKRFSSQTAMRVHMKSHSDERMYPCKECTYAGRTASALYIHMSTHATDLCVCEICSKTFKSARNLNDHLRRVHCKDKKHECTYCHKRFVDRYMLMVHMRCHTGVRPYKCDKCDKSFIRSDGLKEHSLTHEQRVYFDCNECGKRFTSKRGLARHTCICSNSID